MKSGHAASRLSSLLDAGAKHGVGYKEAVLFELLSNHVPHRLTSWWWQGFH